MIIFIPPTALTWEEKNTGDYTYKHLDFSKMDKFLNKIEEGK